VSIAFIFQAFIINLATWNSLVVLNLEKNCIVINWTVGKLDLELELQRNGGRCSIQTLDCWSRPHGVKIWPCTTKLVQPLSDNQVGIKEVLDFLATEPDL
jgi:hypothetical protein